MQARAAKAYAVDSALTAVDELTLLTGAAGLTRASPLVKVRADLAALCYADGIHDGLYRSVGKTLLAGTSAPRKPASLLRPPAPATV
jgi:hypothetical protein